MRPLTPRFLPVPALGGGRPLRHRDQTSFRSPVESTVIRVSFEACRICGAQTIRPPSQVASFETMIAIPFA